MKTLAILAALTVVAAPAFAGEHAAAGHKMEKKTEVKTEVSTTMVSGTAEVSATKAAK